MTAGPVTANASASLFYGAPAVAFVLHTAAHPAYAPMLAALDEHINDLTALKLAAAHQRETDFHARAPALSAASRTALRSTSVMPEGTQTMTLGFTTSSWRTRYGPQVATSSGCGWRFSGGRHLTTLQMYTSSRCKPMA